MIYSKQKNLINICCLLIFISSLHSAYSFLSSKASTKYSTTSTTIGLQGQQQRVTSTELFAGGLFGRGKSGKGFGKTNEDESVSVAANAPSTPATSSNIIFEIPVKFAKIGPLRFFLQIYLVSEQNNPAPNSWLTKQYEQQDDVSKIITEEESIEGLEVFYQDGSAMCRILLSEDKVQFIRCGKRPSLKYMLQESLLLHGVLDELQKIALDVPEEAIDDSKRLLLLNNDADIDKARENLPARKEK